MDQPRRPVAPPPVLDMTPDGEFRDSVPPRTRSTWLDRVLARIGGIALLMAFAAGGFVLVALAILFLGLLLPVAIGAGLVAFGTLWWRARRLRGQGGPGGDGSGGGIRFMVIRR